MVSDHAVHHRIFRGAAVRFILLLAWFLAAAGILWTQTALAQNQNQQYRLGAGDTVSISVVHSPDLATKTRIDGRGNIRFPYVGEIKIANLTEAQAANKIASELQKRQIIKNPQVLLDVVAFRSEQVTVFGAVGKPGNYPLSSSEDLTSILAEAGGIAADGADYIILTRTVAGQRKHIRLSMQDVATGTGRGNDMSAHAGDVIYVPKMEVFYIEGSVNKPGSYRLEPGMTVMQAIALGGGLTPRGSYSRIELTRRQSDDGKVDTSDANLKEQIKPNDVIRVKERIF